MMSSGWGAPGAAQRGAQQGRDVKVIRGEFGAKRTYRPEEARQRDVSQEISQDRVPQMAMAIDEPRDDDAPARVDRLRARDIADIRRDARNRPRSDENVGAIEVADVIVHRQNDGVLDEDFTRTHGRPNNKHAIKSDEKMLS